MRHERISYGGYGLPEAPSELAGSIEELVQRFSREEPRFAQQTDVGVTGTGSSFKFDKASSIWKREDSTAVGEAVLLCTGSLMYDRVMESYASVGSDYQYRHVFKGLRKLMDSGDLVVGSLGCLVADMYPTVTRMSHSLSGRGHYTNARIEYLDALRYAGFDALALAHPFNLAAGVRGALATEQNVLDQQMIPSGLGISKAPLFEVNGIRIGLVSYTLRSTLTDTLTEEGRAQLLNTFNPQSVRNDIGDLKARGAEFVLAYLDTRSEDSRYRYAQREQSAKELANCGADYVVCTAPITMSRYTQFDTEDGRRVPIATSLGTLAAGIGAPYTRGSAVLRVTLRRNHEGRIEIADTYVPVQRHVGEHGGLLPIAVAHDFYGISRLKSAEKVEVQGRIGRILGRQIPIDPARRVSTVTPARPQHSPKEISQLLGVKFSTEALAALGDRLHEPISVAATPDGLSGDSCAIVMQFTRGRTGTTYFKGIASEHLERKNPVMAISEKDISSIPTLVVPNAWQAYMSLVSATRDRYAPFTVAVTGTAGKTTTKDMLGVVFPQHMQTLHITGNGNTEIRAASSIHQLSTDDRAFIHEVHGATPGSASAHSKMLRPDVAIITSIGEGHLQQMGSLENIVRGKLSIIEGLSEDGVLILNNDNEYLRGLTPEVPTIRYGIEDPNVHYHARNIRSFSKYLEFEIVEPDGIAHFVRLYLTGKHNVSNALAVFAAARQALIPVHKIVAGLSRFRPSATRQNIIEVGGYKVFLDAYNSNVLSMTLSLEALEEIECGTPDGRRIVVMGDMGEQGSKFVENHELIGRRMSELNLDLFYGLGEGTAYTAEALASSSIEVSHFTEADDLIRALGRDLRPGDVILFKGAGSVNLPETVVYPLLGRIA